jgi:hypothetical protein
MIDRGYASRTGQSRGPSSGKIFFLRYKINLKVKQPLKGEGGEKEKERSFLFCRRLFDTVQASA